MSFDGLLRDTCIILKRTLGAQDDMGHQAETWAAVEMCRCRVDSATNWQGDLSVAGYVAADHVIFMREPKAWPLNEVDYRIRWLGDDHQIVQAMQVNEYAAKHHLEVRVKTVHERRPA